MKNVIILINILILIGITSIFTEPERSNRDGTEQIETTVADIPKVRRSARSQFSIVSSEAKKMTAEEEFVYDFIREMAEARMMDLEEGKIAQQRSTTKDLKSYGTLMVNQQTEMLNEIKKLASLKNVTLPTALGEEKSEGLKNLKEVHGKSFDKKFIKMMIADHKRDVKKFERATRSTDADVQVFATRYLPYVQSHLDKIKALK